MRLNKGAGIDVSQVTDRRGLIGRLGGGPKGWLVSLVLSIAGRRGGLLGVVLALVLLFVGSLGVHALTNRGSNASIKQECAADNATDQLDCRNVLYINSIPGLLVRGVATGLRRDVYRGGHGLLQRAHEHRLR
jgi:hypothetical protein